MAQLLLQGTRFVDFLGFNAWVGGEGEISAIPVTEWDEPQAVIGSYLHKYAYPERYAAHQERGGKLPAGYNHSSGVASCIQHRGEYLFVSEGSKGTRAYDIASVANKGFSLRFVTAPFSELGHDTHIESKNATCVALPTTQPVAPERNTGELMREINLEQPFHPIYHYAFIADAEEGLIVVNVDTLVDLEPRNNFLERALTWNDKGILTGIRHLTIAGRWFFASTPRGVVVLDMNDPLQPQVVTTVPVEDPRAVQVQFRYAFVTTAKGLQVIDISQPTQPTLIESALVPLRQAHKLHVARTYAYVANGSEGVAIIDVTKADQPVLYRMFNAGGQIADARDVVVASTNASPFLYVADGSGGLKVVQLTSPDTQPNFYGYAAEPEPQLVATWQTKKPALSLTRGLERDRAVDESGGQIAVLGRVGSRPFNAEEMKKLYMNPDGTVWKVTDKVDGPRGITSKPLPFKPNRIWDMQPENHEVFEPQGAATDTQGRAGDDHSQHDHAKPGHQTPGPKEH